MIHDDSESVEKSAQAISLGNGSGISTPRGRPPSKATAGRTWRSKGANNNAESVVKSSGVKKSNGKQDSADRSEADRDESMVMMMMSSKRPFEGD